MSDVADQAECWSSGKRIHNSGIRIGDDQHIARVNCLKSAYAGAVERYSLNKSAFFKFTDRHTKMLPCSWHIHKFQVHHLCAALFGKLQYLFGCHALNSPFFYPTMAAEIAGLSCLY